MAAGANDEHAAGGHRHRCDRGRRLLAGPQAGQDHRRTCGIGRRRHPGIKPEVRWNHHALPVEGRGDAPPAFPACGDEGRDDEDDDEGAQRHRVAHVEARRWPAGLEPLRGEQRPFDMGAPQRHRPRIGLRGRELVGDGGRRPMGHAGLAVEPAQTVVARREADENQRNGGRSGEDEEDEKRDGPRHRRKPQPHTEPGHREEKTDRGGDRRERRPQPLPEGDPPRLLEGVLQHDPGGIARGCIRRMACVGQMFLRTGRTSSHTNQRPKTHFW